MSSTGLSAVNNLNFTPTIEEKLFGIMSSPYDIIKEI